MYVDIEGNRIEDGSNYTHVVMGGVWVFHTKDNKIYWMTSEEPNWPDWLKEMWLQYMSPISRLDDTTYFKKIVTN